MSDEQDLASDREEIARDTAIRAAARDIPPGIPGYCVECGEWFDRLVRGACVACRVRYRGEKQDLIRY